MPQNKSFLFARHDQEISTYAQALCHPARLKIIELLKEQDFLSHQEFHEKLPLSTGSISQHLAYLYHLKIINKDELAGVVGYRLNWIGWQNVKSSINTYFARVG
jgi:predicted transcriptional regulator